MLPSEETLIKFEKMAKSARDKKRTYIGSSDGEDLQMHFRPSFSRLPPIDPVIGEGSLEERMRGALDFRKSRAEIQRIAYPSFANFMGHILQWGFTMILTEVMQPTELVGYINMLVQISEEHGGIRTAYQYDLSHRAKIAHFLESNKNIESGTWENPCVVHLR